jgi:hypothetical protein
MSRIRWFACLLSLAVSTQIALGQTASYPTNPATVDSSDPADPACVLQKQVEALLRCLQHGNDSSATPSTECTRYQTWWTVHSSSQGLLPVQVVETGVQRDCCEAPGTCPHDSCCGNWLTNCVKNWVTAWQRGSCQMAQVAQTISDAAKPETVPSKETCPYVQAMKACMRCVKSCCANAACGKDCCKDGTCCQDGPANANQIRIETVPGTQAKRFTLSIQLSAKKDGENCCPPSPFPTAECCPSTGANAFPNCSRATAGKPGCCANCGCKNCGKGSSASNDMFDLFWFAFNKLTSQPNHGGFNPMPGAGHSMMGCGGPWIELPPPHALLGGGPHCPIMGPLPCNDHLGFGPLHFPMPGSEHGPTPWMGAVPCPPSPMAGMYRPHPWTGFAPPAPGWTPPWGAPPPGVKWSVPQGCTMPGPMNPWGPWIVFQDVPQSECKPPMQPVSLPQSGACCKDDCKIVAKDGVVHITTSKFEAFCSTVTCTSNHDRVVLEGNVRLVSKKGSETTRIEAPRVVVDLNQGTFTIESGMVPPPTSASPVNIDLLPSFSSSFFH